jgi:hypothetical protein
MDSFGPGYRLVDTLLNMVMKYVMVLVFLSPVSYCGSNREYIKGFLILLTIPLLYDPVVFHVRKPSQFDGYASWTLLHSQFEGTGDHHCGVILGKITYVLAILQGQLPTSYTVSKPVRHTRTPSGC